MNNKFITTWFHCEADNETVKKKTGFLKKKEVEKKVYYKDSPNYDHYAEMLAKTYNDMDDHGYDVVNVVPINTGASEPYSGVLKNGKKHYMGEKCYSVTRGAIVVGKRREADNRN